MGGPGATWSELEARISARELQGRNSKGVRISLTEMLKRCPAKGITLENGKTGQIEVIAESGRLRELELGVIKD